MSEKYTAYIHVYTTNDHRVLKHECYRSYSSESYGSLHGIINRHHPGCTISDIRVGFEPILATITKDGFSEIITGQIVRTH